MGTLPPSLLTFARSALVLRARYAEDVLEEVATEGPCQYVVLGAGFDTFAWRQPEWADRLTVFEVDHPATQAQKRKLLREIGFAEPANLRPCGVDFEKTSLQDGLAAAGFDPGCLTMVSWLGVTQYLTGGAIRQTLAFVQTLKPGSSLVFSFILREDDLDESEREMLGPFLDAGAAQGEPFLSRFSPGELLAELSAMGYRKVDHFSPEEAARRYFANRTDQMRPPVVEQLMRATV